MLYVYIGNCAKRAGIVKIGETARRYLSDRMHELRDADDLRQVCYVQAHNGTKELGLFAEAELRYRLAKHYKCIENDHFIVADNEYAAFTALALDCLEKFFEREGVEYIVKRYKAHNKRI